MRQEKAAVERPGVGALGSMTACTCVGVSVLMLSFSCLGDVSFIHTILYLLIVCLPDCRAT